MNYLAQKRIFTSQELLTSTDLNQAAIAKQCGFSSSSYFPNVSENMRHDSYRLQKTVYTLTDDNYIISFILLVRSPRLNRMIPATSAIAQPIGIAVQIAPTPNNGAHA